MGQVAARLHFLRCEKRLRIRHGVPSKTFLLAHRELARIKIGVLKQRVRSLEGLLRESRDHHDYCGWGDAWERECAGDLPERIQAALDL